MLPQKNISAVAKWKIQFEYWHRPAKLQEIDNVDKKRYMDVLLNNST